MAAIACPTWAEVLRFEPEELTAINIVKGECNGDEFLWEQPWFNQDTQKMTKGCFKSTVENEQRRSVGRAERTY